jgi:hypothetical protein
MNPDVVELSKWFAQLGEREYPWVPGNLSMLDLQRLSTNRDYGLKSFLTYMGARAGASQGFVPAWLKVVGTRSLDGGSLRDAFAAIFHGKPNAPRNPMWDERLATLDVPACAKHVEKGELSTAFNKLKVRGAGHKIRAMFLLDLAVFSDAEARSDSGMPAWTIAGHYLYCQPVDTWVRLMSDSFKDLDGELLEGLPLSSREYDLSDEPEKVVQACRMINLALKAQVSPLKLNQGVWFFGSYVAADEERFKEVLSKRNVAVLKDELEPLRGFLPSDWLTPGISDEQKWEHSFAASPQRLRELADEALAEHRAGRTQVLDPYKL